MRTFPIDTFFFFVFTFAIRSRSVSIDVSRLSFAVAVSHRVHGSALEVRCGLVLQFVCQWVDLETIQSATKRHLNLLNGQFGGVGSIPALGTMLALI
jgi:hypothetical protein